MVYLEDNFSRLRMGMQKTEVVEGFWLGPSGQEMAEPFMKPVPNLSCAQKTLFKVATDMEDHGG